MNPLDPVRIPTWLAAAIAIVCIGLLVRWANSASATDVVFTGVISEQTEATETLPVETTTVPIIVTNITLRHPPGPIRGLEDIDTTGLDDVAMGMLEEAFGEHPGELQLVGIEHRDGELLAILFDKKSLESHVVGVGESIAGHEVTAIDPRGVSLNGEYELIRLNLLEPEEP